jgi:hypothetical protein
MPAPCRGLLVDCPVHLGVCLRVLLLCVKLCKILLCVWCVHLIVAEHLWFPDRSPGPGAGGV